MNFRMLCLDMGKKFCIWVMVWKVIVFFMFSVVVGLVRISVVVLLEISE